MKRIAIVFLLIVMSLSLFACNIPETSIVGTWKHTTSTFGVENVTYYTFCEDGTGFTSNVLDVKFTYAFSDDALFVTSTMMGVEKTDKYTFSFDGDKLYLVNNKKVIELVRVKEQETEADSEAAPEKETDEAPETEPETISER